MIIIKKVDRPHGCLAALSVNPEVQELWLGSIVECDCGQQYILRDDPMEGQYWAKYDPNPRTA